MTNFNLISVFSVVLLSCSGVKNNADMTNDFTILSAEKATWFGGRDGVTGSIYNFILKNNKELTFRFTNLKRGRNVYPLITKVKNDSVFISVSVTDPNPMIQLNMETGKEIEKNVEISENESVSLEYLLGSSKIIHSIKIPNISRKNSDHSGEALPN